jgi:hypothetical protein
MGLSQFSRGLLIAVIFGLLFTLWVNPGTTGGLLLLMVVATGFMYLLVSAIHILWLGIKRSRSPKERTEASSVSRHPFKSHRRLRTSSDAGSDRSE